MTTLHENDTVTVGYDDHPQRTDSPEYLRSRKWLMETAGGCYVCGGPVDLAHPEAPVDATGMEDHHGGGIYRFSSTSPPILVGLGLAPLEWAGGWGADPARVVAFAEMAALVSKEISEPGASPAMPTITDTAGVMAWADSVFNANVRLCHVHHIAVPNAHTPDMHGHEAVGIHHCPFPIWALQATCEWARFDLWGGSSGTVAVAPHPSGDGSVVVLHVHPSHPVAVTVGQRLPATHPHARAGHAGYRGTP